MSDPKGIETEDLIEQICSKMFFSDFTIRSLKFTKSSGNQKQAADLLVAFDTTLLAFQVKTKHETKAASEKTDVDFRRIEKAVESAVTQLKTTRRALKNRRFCHLRTVRGFDLPFDSQTLEKVVGIVILDLIGEEEFPQEERTAIFNGFDFRFDMPIHIFTREDFERLSEEIDTLPDFIKFLNTREVLCSQGLLVSGTLELDFLTTYKTQPDLIQRAIEDGVHLYIQEGTWEHYVTEYVEDITRRNWLNQPSYLIDAVIDWFHSSVDFDLGVSLFNRPEAKLQGTVQGYLAVAVELAKIPRLERRTIGERMLRCMHKADQVGHGHSLIMSPEQQTATLVLASDRPRQQRATSLYNLAAMAYCAYDLSQIIGIATEPLWHELRSYDAIVLQDVKFENAEQLREEAKYAYGEINYRHSTEYGGQESETKDS